MKLPVYTLTTTIFTGLAIAAAVDRQAIVAGLMAAAAASNFCCFLMNAIWLTRKES